jgi:hypothetical protein
MKDRLLYARDVLNAASICRFLGRFQEIQAELKLSFVTKGRLKGRKNTNNSQNYAAFRGIPGVQCVQVSTGVYRCVQVYSVARNRSCYTTLGPTAVTSTLSAAGTVMAYGIVLTRV